MSRSPLRDPIVWLGIAAATFLVMWSMRAVLVDPFHTVWGQSIDAIHAFWLLWWKQQDPTIAWVDYPAGGSGAVLPPVGVAMASQLGTGLGAPLAYSVFCGALVIFDVVMIGGLAARVTGSVRAGVVVPLLFFCARPTLAQVAMGNPESVAIGWLCAAIWASILWVESAPPYSERRTHWLVPTRRGAAWSFAVGALFAISVVENPYTLVPGCIAAVGFAGRRLLRTGGAGSVLLAAVAGAATVGGRLAAVEGKPGGTVLPNARLAWRGLEWQMYDIQTLYAQHLVWPWPLPHLEATQETIAAADAHHFLGWSLLGLAVLGLGWRGGRWALGAGAMVALALGSAPWGNPGPPGPFLLLNQLLSVVIAPITQPERFLVFAVLGLCVPAGIGLTRLAALLSARPRGALAFWTVAIGVVTAEALVTGGPAIEVPTLSTRSVACFADLPPGPVFTLEQPGKVGMDAAAGMFLQTVHGQPGTHHGLSGWAHTTVEADNKRLRRDLLEALGGLRGGRPANHVLRDLRCRGITTAVLRDEQVWRGLPDPVVACGGWVAIPLPADFGGPCPGRATELADRSLTGAP